MDKICELCGKEYIPNEWNQTVQKYCSKSCKEKMTWRRQKASGHIRSKKGGYPRAIHIQLWMEARQSDNTAPCHYCKKRLIPDNFILDHKVPVSSLTTKEEIQNPGNLVVCCKECNIKKGNKFTYEEFVKMMESHE